MLRIFTNYLIKRKCRRTKRQFAGYLDHRLGQKEQQIVEKHLASCSACRQEYESLQATINLLHQLPSAKPPRSFTIAGAELEHKLKPMLWLPAFGKLRAAAITAATLCAIAFIGDWLNLFQSAMPLKDASQEEERGFMPFLDEAPGSGESLDNALGIGEASGLGWLETLEFALLGITIVLGIIVLISWRKSRQK